MNFNIKKCELEEARTYSMHCMAHLQEKGIGGIYAHPFPSSHQWDEEDFYQKIFQRWSLPAFAPNWEIGWVAVVNEQMVGHINLKCGPIDAAKHRMRLGMGILTPYRSMGIGKALMNTAIEWTKAQPQISWIDLSVFSENVAAMRLYESVGFKAHYTIEDALRVEGTSIDDIQMSLKLN